MVKTTADKGTLKIRWTHQGKRYSLSLGLKDTEQHRQIARIKAAAIEQDILLEQFDPSLEKYKKSKQSQGTDPIDLLDLWDRYTEFKRPQLAVSTIYHGYGQARRTIAKFPSLNPIDAAKNRDWMIQNLETDVTRRMMVSLTACCRWAVERGYLKTNPFLGLDKPRKQKKKSEEEDINPYTAEERDRIIQAFSTNRYFKYYTPLVRFLFMTGCRPSEALGLQWKHIKKDYSSLTFEQSCTQSDKGLVITPGLKTQRRRTVPLNRLMREFLNSYRQQLGNPGNDAIVFPSPRGKLIDFSNFEERGWKHTLDPAGIERRNPYQMRHTFITLALKSGMSPQDVAKIVGNSAKIIYEHYAGVSRVIEVPEF
jgi:integrase